MPYAPLIAVIAYLLAALVLAVAGPVHYYDLDVPLVSGYLTAICAAMAIGYHLAVKANIAVPRRSDPPRMEEFPRRLFFFLLVIAFAGFLITLATFISSGANLDVSAIGEAYNQNYKGYEKNTGNYSLSFILYSLTAPPTFIVTIWGIWNFKSFTWLIRIAILLTVFGAPLIFTLSAGTQKSIGDIAIFMVTLLALRAGIAGRIVTPGRALAIGAVGIVGLFAFAAILSQRYAFIGIGAENINTRETSLISYNIDHPIFSIFGTEYGLAFSIISLYLTNGYNGLSYALHGSSTWAMFLGSSYSVSVIAQRLFGLPFAYEYTYPFIAAYESGWGETRWYTAFSWFASDVTFIGTIPLFGFFAYAYGRAWIESVRFRNPYSMLLFSLLSLGAFMLPANNQLMQAPGPLATLGIVIYLYLRYRRRFNQLGHPA